FLEEVDAHRRRRIVPPGAVKALWRVASMVFFGTGPRPPGPVWNEEHEHAGLASAANVRRSVFHRRYARSDLAQYRHTWRCRYTTRQVEEWVYNPGTTQFLRYLTFVDGRLANITFGP